MAKYKPSTLDDFEVMRRSRDSQRRMLDASNAPSGSNVYATTEKVQELDLGNLETRVGDLETGKQDKLTAGANIDITSNIISATDTTYTAGTNVQISAGNIISATDTTYSAATQSADGLMSSADKTKLDGVEAGAEVNDVTSVNGSTGAVVIADATQNASGLMSSTDKTKLDNIADDVLPVGSMVIMRTDTAPALTGTWTKVTGFHLHMTNASSTTLYLYERTA